MSNATANLVIPDTIGGPGPFNFHLPVDGGTHIYKGTLVSQLTATGMLVPYSTASTGVCVGVAQMESDNSGGADGAKRCLVESNRMYALANGAGGAAFSEASLIGAVVYATDDHTVSNSDAAGTAVGFFYGMEADGKVRVLINPAMASIVAAIAALA